MSADIDAKRTRGGIESAAATFVASLRFQPGDPRALLGQIAVRLAQRVDETGALPAAVRELRQLLMQLAEVPDQPAGPVDALRAQRAARRVVQLITETTRVA